MMYGVTKLDKIHAYCVLCWYLGSVARMCIQCLSALVSWARLCVSIMLDVCKTTDSHIRSVICRCIACVFDNVFISIA